jgi:hypothetical protein
VCISAPGGPGRLMGIYTTSHGQGTKAGREIQPRSLTGGGQLSVARRTGAVTAPRAAGPDSNRGRPGPGDFKVGADSARHSVLVSGHRGLFWHVAHHDDHVPVRRPALRPDSDGIGVTPGALARAS